VVAAPPPPRAPQGPPPGFQGPPPNWQKPGTGIAPPPPPPQVRAAPPPPPQAQPGFRGPPPGVQKGPALPKCALVQNRPPCVPWDSRSVRRA